MFVVCYRFQDTHLDQSVLIMVSSLAIPESTISVILGNTQGTNTH
jgi:hypothetical protein